MRFDGALPKNVLGTPLRVCCRNPITGFYRSGLCETGVEDTGKHTICIEITEEFLEFSQENGNDLTTPRPEFSFPGLKPGNHWCLCALRWKEALDEGCAPLVRLEATHESALEIVSLEDLQAYACREQNK